MKRFLILSIFIITIVLSPVFSQKMIVETNQEDETGIKVNATTGIGVNSESQQLAIFGLSVSSIGVLGQSNEDIGVFGQSGFSYGVVGDSPFIGMQGQSMTGIGVIGLSNTSVGVIGVSNNAESFDFDAQGAGIDYGSTSSRRWKNNIENIDQPIEKLSLLRGVYFNWDKDHGGRHDIGFIAEEVGKVLPEIVGYEKNGIDAIGLDYGKLTPLLVEAVNAMRREYQNRLEKQEKEIKELQEEIDGLKRMVSGLGNHIDRMTTRINTLK